VPLPGDASFAFTILDDTDDSTLENVEPVYRLIEELGLRTTKTVWPMDCPEGSRLYFAADTLQRPEYCAFVERLAAAGFEIASHGATMESSPRERTQAGLDLLQARFGDSVRLHANHGQNRENLYWGRHRFHTPGLARLLARIRPGVPSQGAEEGSPWFWGDLARERFRYVRNFTFRGLDLRRHDPRTPYRLRQTPWVDRWFSTTDAPDVRAFNARVNRAALERLEADGGVCIVSTHLGKGFCVDGRLDARFEETLRWLASRPGWFVPVSTVLDHLRSEQVRSSAPRSGGRAADAPLSARALARLELAYLVDQLALRLRSDRGTARDPAG